MPVPRLVGGAGEGVEERAGPSGREHDATSGDGVEASVGGADPGADDAAIERDELDERAVEARDGAEPRAERRHDGRTGGVAGRVADPCAPVTGFKAIVGCEGHALVAKPANRARSVGEDALRGALVDQVGAGVDGVGEMVADVGAVDGGCDAALRPVA